MWVARDYQTTAQFYVAKFATPPREKVEILRVCRFLCIFYGLL
jgi:hypothetical protein